MRGGNSFNWTAEAEDTLRTMWAAGHSAGAIGDALGINRNCVIGKRNRLKLSQRRPSQPYKRKVSAHRRHKAATAPPVKPIAEIPGWPTKAQLMAGR